MKKKLLLIFTILITITSFSQEKFGVFTGINYSYFTNGVIKQMYAEDSFGIQIGAYYETPLSKKISFRPKIAFSQQGDRAKSSNNLNYFELNQIDYKLTYLNLPLDFKFWNKIYVLAGPQIGILINEERGHADLGNVESNVDFGLNLGTGFTVNKMFFEFGAYQGLTTLLSYKYYGTQKTVKNGFAKFTVGYKF